MWCIFKQIIEFLLGYGDDSLSSYGEEQQESRLSETRVVSSSSGLDSLLSVIPGNPGRDYPTFAVAPKTGFTCDDKAPGGEILESIMYSYVRHGLCSSMKRILRGYQATKHHSDKYTFSGYYADREAGCQSFHICGQDAEGAMATYTFLCPNGTIFNQEYFICDWWFNVECEDAEALAAARNADLLRERQEAEERAAARRQRLQAQGSARVETVVRQPASQYR